MAEIDPYELLTRSGWSDDRRVDPGRALARLEIEGYIVPPATVRFIENVDGITIEYERHGRGDSIWFDVARAIDLTFKAWVDDYSSRVEAALLPMGYASHDHLLLTVSEAGIWFGGFDDQFGLLGHGLVEAVEAIATTRPLTPPDGRGR